MSLTETPPRNCTRALTQSVSEQLAWIGEEVLGQLEERRVRKLPAAAAAQQLAGSVGWVDHCAAAAGGGGVPAAVGAAEPAAAGAAEPGGPTEADR